MLKKPYRLTQSARFVELRRQGRSWSHPLVVVMTLPSELAVSRFGFSVSRRIGGAVQRNRAKRLLREAVRLRLDQIAPGHDVLFVARGPIRDAAFADVESAVDGLLRRAGLLHSGAPADGGTRDVSREV